MACADPWGGSAYGGYAYGGVGELELGGFRSKWGSIEEGRYLTHLVLSGEQAWPLLGVLREKPAKGCSQIRKMERFNPQEGVII